MAASFLFISQEESPFELLIQKLKNSSSLCFCFLPLNEQYGLTWPGFVSFPRFIFYSAVRFKIVIGFSVVYLIKGNCWKCQSLCAKKITGYDKRKFSL